VCVTLDILPRHLEQFMEIMELNAKTSLAQEPGCRQFDVCTDEARPNEVFLYEIYDSPEAFQHHLTSQHFIRFDADVSAMVKSKSVKTYAGVR
ncbi:MAG: putative quinol monooxygenase, partial [Pseudomonadota bacterium]